MRPGVAGNLVTLSNHSLDDSRPARRRVDSTLANVNSGDKKGGFEAIFSKLIKDLVGVDVWSVIVGDSHSTRVLTSVDASPSVLNITLLWARVIAGAGA